MMRRSLSDEGEKKVKAGDLLAVLNKVRPALSPRGIVPQSDHFLFMGGGLVGANNDQINAVAKLPSGLPDIVGSVEAGTLYKLLSTLPEEAPLTILNKGDSKLQIKSGRRAFGLPLNPEGDRHAIVRKIIPGKKSEFQPFDSTLRESIVLCSFYASRDLTRADLSGVWIDAEDILASDSYRVAWAKRTDKGDQECLIPASAAVLLKDYSELDEFLIDESGAWIHFRGKGLDLASKLIGVPYKTEVAKALFPTTTKKATTITIPSAIKSALDRALVLLDEIFLLDKQVVLDFSGKQLTCSCDQAERGWFSETIDLKEDLGKDFSLKVNPIFVQEILNHSTQMTLVDEKRVLFTSKAFRCLLALS
jgi:DNA polymerase III sliding clamp (beta) subunit (PCNA family)